jgi:predicted dehydrogenase/threonine dehydrogenase-like Zn-dependent dehydrogenase
MRQVLQDLNRGDTIIADVPVPLVSDDHVLIESFVSLISTGTERMLVDFGKAGLVEKARQQPDKVKLVVDKIRTDGLKSTYEAVKSKLDQLVPLGYANVGRVVEVGNRINSLRVGDRVVSNGFHAEYVCVGANLCAKVPDDVSSSDAAFAIPGAIALQGVRLSRPTVGECFVVIGLGLIGLLTVQILRANGCRVLGVDFDAEKLSLAEVYGASTENAGSTEGVLKRANQWSRGRGVDGVIITASAKKGDIVHQAATMSRKRGRIVLVGVVNLELTRSDFYEKELSFQVSCSYGPGRHDPQYEEEGHDYPVGFVRWTEQRNFEAVLDMLSSGDINAGRLISSRFAIDDGVTAYNLLSSDRSCLGILLEYGEDGSSIDGQRKLQINSEATIRSSDVGVTTIGALGAGNYAGRVLLPAFREAGAVMDTVVSSQGMSGTQVGKKLGFRFSATDPEEVFKSDSINAVVIVTQHDSHASYVARAIASSKHVFVEKPLAISLADIDKIERAYLANSKNPIVMIGFNRRFAPFVRQVKSQLDKRADPISMILNCNAGHIDASSWVQDAKKGGGRIIGEACHFIDLARFLAGSKILDVSARPMRSSVMPSGGHDSASITISFASGSLAVVNYFANGHRAYPKERFELYQSGQTFVVENYRKLCTFGSTLKNSKAFRADRGQAACVQAFTEAVNLGGPSPIPFDEILEVSRFSIDAAMQIRG